MKKVFGKFEVLTNFKISSGYKISVSDGNDVLNIPLLLTENEVEEGLERVENLNVDDWTLEYFKMVVSGSLLIGLKYGK